MKRAYLFYALVVAAMSIAGLLGVRLTQTWGTAAPLRRLGRAAREYAEARNELLLSNRDATPALLAFASDPGKPLRARVEALRILQELASRQTLQEGGDDLVPLVADSARELRLEAIRALGQMRTVRHAAPLVALLKTEHDSVLFAEAVAAVKLIAQPLAKEIRSAIDTRDSAGLDSLVPALDSLPLGKGEVLPRLAYYYRSTGELARGAECFRRLGAIGKWWACGAFPNRSMSGWDRDFGPESAPFDPAQRFPVSSTDSSQWFPFRRVDAWGHADIDGAFPLREYAIAYFFTYIHVPSGRDALLMMGSDDAIRVWLNGSLVWSNRLFRSCVAEDDVARVTLHEGVNTLLLKIVQDMGGWRMYCRLTDMGGEAMGDVKFSLAPQLQASPADAIITCMRKAPRAPCFRPESLDVEDEGLVQDVLSVVSDEGAEASRRTAALDLLDHIGVRREVPVGEHALIALAENMVNRKAYDEVLQRIAESIATMGSSRGLDLGLKIRGQDAPAMKLTGNRLISAYCRNRFAALGGTADRSRGAEGQRAVDEVLSLQPQDPWVLLRAASLLALAGDSVRARRVAAPIAMPQRWLLREIQPGTVTAFSAPGASATLKVDSTAFASAEPTVSPKGWLALHSNNLDTTFGGYLPFGLGRMQASGQTAWLMHTKVFAERAESCYVTVSMPARFRVWVNGTLAECGAKDQMHAFYALRSSQEQPQRFDMCSYPVALRPGANTIEVAFVKNWFEVKPTPWFRAGFATADGTTVGCEGNRLLLPGKPAL